MRRIRFGDFMRGSPSDGFGESLYILHDGSECLYIGISRRGIWERWFDRYMGHIRGKYSYCNTDIGDYVVQNLPASLDWTLELWTEADCLEVVEDKKHFRLEDFEAMMIRKLEPVFNVVHNASDRYFPTSDDIADLYEGITE